MTLRRETVLAAALLFLAVAALHYDVIFLGRSLVHSNYINPLDQRGLPQNYGEDMVPHTVWANRNLSLYANVRDPATSWWQWEPSTQYLLQAMKSREWPFWDPYLGAGVPAMANLLPAFFFPPYTLVVALGASVGLRNAYFLFLLWSAGFCSYVFLRAHAVGFAAAVAGGVMVVMSGGLNQNLGSITGQMAACLPPALLATRWFLDRPGSGRAAGLALAYGVIALGSLPPLLIALFGVTALYAVVAIGRGDCAASRARTSLWWAGSIVLSLGLVAFYFVPAGTLIRSVPHVAPFYDGAGLETIPFRKLLQLFSPTLMSGVVVYRIAPFVSDGYAAHIPYVGLACFVAAVCAKPAANHRSMTLFVAAVAASVLVILKVLGLPPVQWIGLLAVLEHVHFAHYLPITLSFLFAFLAAQGIDAILRRDLGKRRAVVAACVAAAVMVLFLAIALREGAFHQLGKGYWLRDWGVLGMVAAAVVVTMGAAVRGARPALVAAAILCLTVFEGIYNDFPPKPKPWDMYARTPPYLRLIRREAPFGRILAFGVPVPNVHGGFKVFGINSMMTFSPPRIYELYRRYTGAPGVTFMTVPDQIPPDPVLDRAGVQFVGVYSVVRNDVRKAEGRGLAKRYDDGYISIYERPAGPRFFFSSEYRVVDTGSALAAIATAPPREIVLEDQPRSPSSPNTPEDPAVEVVDYGLNRIALTIDAPRAGLVYAAESYFDGWTATVGGVLARILPANYAFRAVEVPAGRSAIEFRYWPPGLTAGLWISGFASLTTIALILNRTKHAA